MGRGGGGNPPSPQCSAGKGSKSAGLGGAGAGNILRALIEIICCSKGILLDPCWIVTESISDVFEMLPNNT